jgi:hypothetical protein
VWSGDSEVPVGAGHSCMMASSTYRCRSLLLERESSSRSVNQCAPIRGAANPTNTAINKVSGPWPSSVPKTSIEAKQDAGINSRPIHAIPFPRAPR